MALSRSPLSVLEALVGGASNTTSTVDLVLDGRSLLHLGSLPGRSRGQGASRWQSYPSASSVAFLLFSFCKIDLGSLIWELGCLCCG